MEDKSSKNVKVLLEKADKQFFKRKLSNISDSGSDMMERTHENKLLSNSNSFEFPIRKLTFPSTILVNRTCTKYHSCP